ASGRSAAEIPGTGRCPFGEREFRLRDGSRGQGARGFTRACRTAVPMMFYLYYLSQGPSALAGGFNVFQYVSFRAVCAAITAFLLCLVFGNWVIRKLTSLKFGQPIRTAEEVHRLFELHGAKRGTPTMGGVFFMGSVVVSTLLWARPDNHFVWLCLFTILFTGGLGFVDDYIKVSRKKSDGIPGRVKLICQFLLAAIVIVGTSNAVNLTDGLDGLATGCTVTVASTYAILAYAAGNVAVATYLDLPFYRGSEELTILCT